MEIKHKQGDHKSSPFKFKLYNKPETVAFVAQFTDSCKYNHNDENQGDWNKLTGISFNLIDARQNAVMCGWRYNIEKDEFELCGYYHRNGSFEPPTCCLCSVKANEDFTVKFIFDKTYGQALICIETKNGIFTDTKDFFRFGLARQINTWFGGTLPAPHDMELHLTNV